MKFMLSFILTLLSWRSLCWRKVNVKKLKKSLQVARQEKKVLLMGFFQLMKVTQMF